MASSQVGGTGSASMKRRCKISAAVFSTADLLLTNIYVSRYIDQYVYLHVIVASWWHEDGVDDS